MRENWYLFWPGIGAVMAVMAALGWMCAAKKHKRLRLKWCDLHRNQATVYYKELKQGASLIDDTIKLADHKKRSLAMGALIDHTARVGEIGTIIDRMTNSGGVLSAAGLELQWFIRGMWDSSNKQPLQRDRVDGPSLTNEELSHLRAIYEVYIAHFTEKVICSEDRQLHQKALLAVHTELREQGYDKMLRWPGLLDIYEEFSLVA